MEARTSFQCWGSVTDPVTEDVPFSSFRNTFSTKTPIISNQVSSTTPADPGHGALHLSLESLSQMQDQLYFTSYQDCLRNAYSM